MFPVPSAAPVGAEDPGLEIGLARVALGVDGRADGCEGAVGAPNVLGTRNLSDLGAGVGAVRVAEGLVLGVRVLQFSGHRRLSFKPAGAVLGLCVP